MAKINVDLIYPIGSIYMSVNSTNPSTYFGGTWEAWGTGRVPVGIDTSQTEFNTVEKTGGSKYLQAHRHTLTGGSANLYYTSGSSSNWTIFATETGYKWYTDSDIKDNSGNNITTGGSGNLQPYITCYMWKRTA